MGRHGRAILRLPLPRRAGGHRPSGWTLGTGDADRRAYRFAADRDGSGSIDANIGHPADYRNVDGNLTEQNFLIVRCSQACPVPTGSTLSSADLGTIQQQP